MSPVEAAEYLGVAPNTIRRTMKRTGMRWAPGHVWNATRRTHWALRKFLRS